MARFNAMADSLSVGSSAAHPRSTVSGRMQTGARLRVELRSTASPEGTAELNARLSQERFHSGRRALLEAGLAPDFFSSGDTVSGMTGAYPEEAFIEVVRASSMTEDVKAGILSVLNDSTTGYEEKLRTLMVKSGGRYWRALSEECLPEMRAFGATVSVERGVAIMDIQSRGLLEPEERKDVTAGLEGVRSIPTPPRKDIPHRRMALKTNVLGWGLLMANIGVELDLSEHVSFHLPLYYSGANYFSERVRFRTLAVQPEVRWNFSRTDGFFVGVHAAVALYDVATGGDYRYQDRAGNRPAVGGGMSVGYKLHFKNAPRWGMEFVLGAGAYSLSYDRFVNEKNGPYVDTVDRTYVGPDNAAISVFYEFDLGRGWRR